MKEGDRRDDGAFGRNHYILLFKENPQVAADPALLRLALDLEERQRKYLDDLELGITLHAREGVPDSHPRHRDRYLGDRGKLSYVAREAARVPSFRQNMVELGRSARTQGVFFQGRLQGVMVGLLDYDQFGQPAESDSAGRAESDSAGNNKPEGTNPKGTNPKTLNPNKTTTVNQGAINSRSRAHARTRGGRRNSKPVSILKRPDIIEATNHHIWFLIHTSWGGAVKFPDDEDQTHPTPVSYTHLTLPTKRIV